MKQIQLILAILWMHNAIGAQEINLPFQTEIDAFKKQDSLAFPASNQILFIGSSSFTKWTDVQDYFPTHPIINRGFGGSSLPDIILYTNDIIFPYHPKQIVIYCGENDFAACDIISVTTVVSRVETLFYLIRKRFKKISVAYISIKPSPSRQQLMPKFEAANTLIQQFLKKQKRASFIDVYHAMLNNDGAPIPTLFLEDKLHMNASGYAVWQKLIEPVLKK